MRIAVSGTHGSGKSTLVEDFLAAHPEYVHEPEPYVWLDDANAEPGADELFHQLEVSVERLRSHPSGARVIAERAPLDFVAYLLALRELRRGGDLVDSAVDIAREGMAHLDLIAVLPLEAAVGEVAEEEDPELRAAMNDCLLDIVATERFELLCGVRVVELQGTPRERLAALERAL